MTYTVAPGVTLNLLSRGQRPAGSVLDADDVAFVADGLEQFVKDGLVIATDDQPAQEPKKK